MGLEIPVCYWINVQLRVENVCLAETLLVFSFRSPNFAMNDQRM